jgi:serine/threonine protein phosphatase PrpC
MSDSEPATCVHCGEAAEIADGYCGHCGMRQPDPRDHLEHESRGVAAVTDRGRAHRRNEDAVAVVVRPAAIVAVVCDGVSTSTDPERASQAAADAAAEVLAGQDADFDRAFEAARDAVLALPVDRAASHVPPTTTYIAAAVDDRAATISSLGDCRSYWVDANGARQLTIDDSSAAAAVAEGGISMEEAMRLPNGHAITRWISIDADPRWRPSTVRFEIPGPGHLVLCSDGLWNYAVDPETLAAEMRAADGDTMARARHLVEFANRSGGRDNISVIVVDLPLGTVEP